jgi:TPR repeat protein
MSHWIYVLVYAANLVAARSRAPLTLDESVASLIAAAPAGLVVSLGGPSPRVPDRLTAVSRAPLTIDESAEAVLAFARSGSLRALSTLVLARLFSSVLPPSWYLAHAVFEWSLPDFGSKVPSVWCKRLNVAEAVTQTPVQLNLSSLSGGLRALCIVACISQSKLSSVAESAMLLQQRYNAGFGSTSFDNVIPGVASWFASVQHARSHAHESDLTSSWVRPLLLAKWPEGADASSYTPVTERFVVRRSIADAFSDEVNASTSSLIALALLHLAAIGLPSDARAAVVPKRDAATESLRAPDLAPSSPLFAHDDDAFEALVLAAASGGPGAAHMALSRAASSNLLPRSLRRFRGDRSSCLNALPWAEALAQLVSRDQQDDPWGVADVGVPALWERHEDAFVMSSSNVFGGSIGLLRAEAMEHDDPDANMDYAQVLELGDPLAGIPADLDAALFHYKRAAEFGLLEANARVGALLLRGLLPGDSSSIADVARGHLELAAAQGSIEAVADLGHVYFHGIGVKKSFSKSLAYWSQAVEAGFTPANYGIASVLLQPDARDESGRSLFDHSSALRHLRLASDAGHVPARYLLGSILRSSIDGDDVDCEEALSLFLGVGERWAERAGPANLLSAYSEVSHGRLEQAFLQYLHLSAMGVASAQDNAAFMLEKHSEIRDIIDNSIASRTSYLFHSALAEPPYPLDTHTRAYDYGTSKDVVMSLRAIVFGLYLSAADLGAPHAMTLVAQCLSMVHPDVRWCADGSPEDLRDAAEQWLQLATEEGSGHAAFTLAVSYARGSLGMLAVHTNLSAAWSYLDDVENLDYLAEWVVLLGRVFVIWQGWSSHAVTETLFLCATGVRDAFPFYSDSDFRLHDACIILSRVAIASTMCGAFFIAIFALALIVPRGHIRGPDGVPVNEN